MSAGGGDLQSPLGVLLAFDFLEIRTHRAINHWPGLGRAEHLGTAKVIHQGDQRAGREDGRLPGPSRLRSARLGADQAKAQGSCGYSGRKSPSDRRDAPIEIELADGRPPVESILRDNAHGAHQGQGDREVEMVALLGHIRGGEIGHHTPMGKRQTQTRERRPDPLARLTHGLVRQTDHHEGRLASGDALNLHLHPPGFDTLEGHRHNPRRHARLPACRTQPRECA